MEAGAALRLTHATLPATLLLALLTHHCAEEVAVRASPADPGEGEQGGYAPPLLHATCSPDSAAAFGGNPVGHTHTQGDDTIVDAAGVAVEA